jgi:hypothetical protein
MRTAFPEAAEAAGRGLADRSFHVSYNDATFRGAVSVLLVILDDLITA